MTNTFHELLLSELRMVTYQPGDPEGLTDRSLCQAITLNVNIQSLGYILRPDDLLRLAASPSLEGFFSHLKALVPQVKAQPMYPGFPQQVMAMSEAEYRLHQAIHYFSTYGLETLLGRKVSRGWLPEYTGPARTVSDIALFEGRVIALIPEADAPITVLRTLFGRRERLTNPELTLAMACVPECGAEQLRGLTVRFKENIALLFPALMALPDRKAALPALRAVCAHAGDALAQALEYLYPRHCHLKTSEKKLLVKLLEAYPAANLRANLMQSLQARERNLFVLERLDYNRFSRSPAHREAVRALRNGELTSWHSAAEALIRAHSPEALAFLAERPGYMVRMLNRLLSLQYGAGEIEAALLPHAHEVSGHLALRTIRTLKKRSVSLEDMHKQAVDACREKHRQAMCSQLEAHRAQLMSIEWDSQWRRSDADLRCRRRPVEQAETDAHREENQLKDLLSRKLAELRTARALHSRITKPQMKFRRDSGMYYELPTEKMAKQALRLLESILALEEETALLRKQADQAGASAKQWLAVHLPQIREEGEAQYEAACAEIDRWRKRELRTLCGEHDAQAMEDRLNAALQDLEERYLAAKRMTQYDPEAVSILRTLLLEHFRQAETPLLGRKVYCDLGGFDLAHSVLETEDRSRDGGYIRSGISYRIPDQARYVRFFVYWNDSNRVDIDLHAGGRDNGGQELHIGWNADFRQCGVVHSGDITHSNAAEYIDIDLGAPIREICTNVHLYYGRNSFRDVETCYIGMMAVDSIGQDVKLYDPKNCFFTHRLTQNAQCLYYGYIDVQNRYVRFVGQPNQERWESRPAIESEAEMFSLQDYLDCLFEGQRVTLTDTPEEADLILTMGKSSAENDLSLADHNFFLES